VERARHGRLREGGEKSEVTVLCCDIRGFTRLAAGIATEDVVDLLNDYFRVLVEAVFAFDGTIDKFLGDGLLAVFGSPEADARQHEHGVRAAMAMQAAVRRLNAQRTARGQPACEIGIAVHCGEVLHGFIGAQERMEFTVIGDAVNRASRYCDGARGGEVLISPAVHQRVWRLVEAEAVSVATKHEGQQPAYRVHRIPDDTTP
jgi:adenylate cyclase